MNGPDEPTRRVSSSDGDDPDRGQDPTEVLGPVPSETGEGGPAMPPPEEEEPPRSHLREIVIGLGGAVLGFALAFVIVALSTSGADDELTGDVSAVELEEAQATVAERDARIAELEAELAEAEAAAGDRDEDLAAQVEALDDRSAALDQREQALDEVEAAVAAREAEVAAREDAIEDAEQDQDAGEVDDPDTGDGEAPGDDDGIIDLPDVDEEEVSNAIERLLEQIRGLFGG